MARYYCSLPALLLLSWFAQILLAAAAFTCRSASAQTQGVAPNPLQIESFSYPQGSRTLGHGERLLLSSADGRPQVVQLYCSLGPASLVMLPTGELKHVESSKTKPTNDPFALATQDQMIERLKATGFSKHKFEKGDFYLYAYDCSDEFFAHARAILETMPLGVARDVKNSWGIKPSRPEAPLVVIIMPSRAAFDAIHPMPKQIAAYYDPMTNHVLMYEDQELWDAAPEFAAKQASYIVSHEAVHQLLANFGIQKRLSHWPPWICEGMAEYYCPLKVSNTIRKDNSGLPERKMIWDKPGRVNDLRMMTLLKTKGESGKAIENVLSASQLDANGYALSWGLVHFLANQKADEFRAYLAEVSKYAPLDPENRPVAVRADPCFTKHFGTDYAKLESELQDYLTSRPMQKEYVDPIENQTYYVVHYNEKKGRSFEGKVIVATSPTAAKKWKEQEQIANKNAKFFTAICKNQAEAERQLQKLQGR